MLLFEWTIGFEYSFEYRLPDLFLCVSTCHMHAQQSNWIMNLTVTWLDAVNILHENLVFDTAPSLEQLADDESL